MTNKVEIEPLRTDSQKKHFLLWSPAAHEETPRSLKRSGNRQKICEIPGETTKEIKKRIKSKYQNEQRKRNENINIWAKESKMEIEKKP